MVEKGGAAPGSTKNSFVQAPLAVAYQTHVQTYGWQDWVKNGALAGTSGKSKRWETIRISMENLPVNGGISYQTHVQTYGWQDWVKNGAVAGSVGRGKRLEAIEIKLEKKK